MAEESLSEMSTDFSKLKVPDLKKELKLRGLSTTGNKNELLERLQTSVKSNDAAGSESVDDLEEDLLNDDDDEHLDASESVILENDLDESPNPLKRKIADHVDETDTKEVPPKKLILNRHENITSEIVLPSEKKVEESKPDEEKGKGKGDKKVIRLSQLSAKERLEMRAKKFGVTSLNPDALKVVRAERFGVGNGDNSAASITSSDVTTSVDKLKQRAERFGGSVSTVMSNLENKERMEKRKARFSASSNGAVPDTEKAKLRLERFKQPVK
ncbi:unnamed protein product [Phaedon cochleariae]|uniref:SAP domain-containing protein n=1 Tax=Phaedon cochleariae TaxID=80249 RepID=A0A9P0GY81_PHACE|nr:unnamed protein product [Phaedon cochleariae]